MDDLQRHRKAYAATSTVPAPTSSVFPDFQAVPPVRRQRPMRKRREDADAYDYFNSSPETDISLSAPLPQSDFPSRKGVPSQWEYARSNGFVTSAVRVKRETPHFVPCHSCTERVARVNIPSETLHLACVRALFDMCRPMSPAVAAAVERYRMDEPSLDSVTRMLVVDTVDNMDSDYAQDWTTRKEVFGEGSIETESTESYEMDEDDPEEIPEYVSAAEPLYGVPYFSDPISAEGQKKFFRDLKGTFPVGSGHTQGDDSSAQNVDINAEQVASGIDVQGIPWDNLPFSREDYRATRMHDSNRRESSEMPRPASDLVKEPRRGARFYSFFKNTRRVKCSIVHFQLRNLAWATSKHDVLVMYDAGIVHWDAAAKRKSPVLDLSGSNSGSGGGLPTVQISTMIAKRDLVIAGGFYGEMVAKNLSSGTIVHNKRITYDDNAITNAIDIFDDQIMTSNNDRYVRCFDMATFQRHSAFQFETPVNHATRQPDGKMVCVVGDHKLVQMIDGDSGDRIAQLRGHDDYSFATGWHPDGRLFATGSQDKTCRVWDKRNMSQSICVLNAHIGPVRSLRFSSCGRFLAMAEPKDFVHIYDVNGGLLDSCQEIDFFGEIAGIALTPCAETLYIAVSDRAYSSLMEYERSSGKLVSGAIP